MEMKKLGAIGVLITMLSGLAIEVRSQVIGNKEEIIKLKEREKYQVELLREIKAKVEEINKKIK